MAEIFPDFDEARRMVVRLLEPEKDWRQFAAFRLQQMRLNEFSPAVIAEMSVWTESRWMVDLCKSNRTYFVVTDEQRILGFGCLSKQRFKDQDCREIALEVSAEVEGRGLGTSLYSHMKEHARTHHPGEIVLAKILSDNAKSIRAATKAGFTHIDNGVFDGVAYGVYSPT